ncbi:MAG: hypothetical protein JWP29_506 [Rhodoferax sp.]|nr:hypothetical protein [Rhodoferax sp.]
MASSKSPAADFEKAVNMSPTALARWLKTDESKSVGIVKPGERESVGHKSGRRIVDILRKSPTRRTAADEAHMRKVVGYVHRHLEQRPDGDVTETRWRYSLMNWGHDPVQ